MELLSPEDMLPAVGQGAIGVSCRVGDEQARGWLHNINHRETEFRIKAERALLASLDGSCRTPIGGLAEVEGNQLRLRGLVAREDGSELFEAERTGSVGDAVAIGQDVGKELRFRAGDAV